MKELKLILRQMKELMSQGISFALATVVHVDGSAYRRPGARMLISESGDWWGGISGGCLEGDMLKKAQYSMMNQSIQMVQYDTREDDPFELGVGLGCNGLIDIMIVPHQTYLLSFLETLETHFQHTSESILLSSISKIDVSQHQITPIQACPSIVTNEEWNSCVQSGSSIFKETESHYYFLERVAAKSRIWIFGHSFDSLKLIELCEWMGWEVHWVGNPTKMPKSHQAKVTKIYGWEDSRELVPSDHVVLMTHDFDRDVRLLTDLISKISPNQYVGILGPHKRMDKLQNALGGFLSKELRSQFYSPIGLDLGAQGPYEIAMSIISEILSVTSGREIQSLRDRKGSINA